MTDDQRWLDDGERLGWKLPPKAGLFWRLPVIRHIRSVLVGIKIELWYSQGPGMIGIRSGYDDWVRYAIWRGWA